MRHDTIQRILERTLPVVDQDYRGDANETAAMARQLEHFFSKLYQIEYAEAMGRKIVPLNFEVPSGASAFTYVQMDERGEADILDSYSKDFPMVEEFGTESTGKTLPIAAGFFVSLQDLRAAAMLGRDIESRKADMARRAMERKLDAILCVGDTKSGLKGLANLSGPSVLTAGTDFTGGWSTATSDQIQEDVEALQKKIFDDTLGVHGNPDNGTKLTLALPPAAYSAIATRRLDNFHEMTMLQYILKNSPFVGDIVSWARLATAGASSATRAVWFERSNDVLEGIISQEVEILPMQPKALGWQVPLHMRTGGVIARYPKAIFYADGV